MIALKGQAQQTEKESVPDGWRIVAKQGLQVPGLQAERHLVHIARIDHNEIKPEDQ
jgi:16S rRNA (guanine527-N7)-methyltransferase